MLQKKRKLHVATPSIQIQAVHTWIMCSSVLFACRRQWANMQQYTMWLDMSCQLITYFKIEYEKWYLVLILLTLQNISILWFDKSFSLERGIRTSQTITCQIGHFYFKTHCSEVARIISHVKVTCKINLFVKYYIILQITFLFYWCMNSISWTMML